MVAVSIFLNYPKVDWRKGMTGYLKITPFYTNRFNNTEPEKFKLPYW
jgi:hypothetical protein